MHKIHKRVANHAEIELVKKKIRPLIRAGLSLTIIQRILKSEGLDICRKTVQNHRDAYKKEREHRQFKEIEKIAKI